MHTARADLGEAAEDEPDDDLEDEDERAGHTRYWVRYVMPVMVGVDCGTDEMIRPRQAAEVAEEDTAGQLVAGLAEVQLRADYPAVGLHVDDLQQGCGVLKIRPWAANAFPRSCSSSRVWAARSRSFRSTWLLTITWTT